MSNDEEEAVSPFRSIENLIYSYSRFVDAGDFGSVGALLKEATFVGRGDLIVGGEAVRKWLEGSVILYADGTPRTKHLVTNVSIEIDPVARTARSHSYVTVMQALPGAPLQTIVCGRYLDEFTQRDHDWRFTTRKVMIDLIGDVSHHLRQS